MRHAMVDHIKEWLRLPFSPEYSTLIPNPVDNKGMQSSTMRACLRGRQKKTWRELLWFSSQPAQSRKIA